MGSQVECGTLKLAIPILTHAVCTRCLCTQTKPTNQTKPEFHQPRVTPNETKGKEMPRNQKPKGINAKRDFPVQLDL